MHGFIDISLSYLAILFSMDESNLGRELAALRKIREKTCPVCGTVFHAFAKQAFDTKLCANRASYARHAEKRRAEKREQYHRKHQEGREE